MRTGGSYCWDGIRRSAKGTQYSKSGIRNWRPGTARSKVRRNVLPFLLRGSSQETGAMLEKSTARRLLLNLFKKESQ
jgi:hypothetical protein